MGFWAWFSNMRDLPRYILTRGLLLACILFGAVLLILLRARDPGAETFLLLAYADQLQTVANVVLGAGLIGSALLEDVLESTGG